MDWRERGEDAALSHGARWRPAGARGDMGPLERDGGDDLPNATIIVSEANNWMRRFHDRMPVILDWRDTGPWMAGECPGALLRPAPDDALREWIVSTGVSKAGAGDDDPALIEPIKHA
jgi:putative SOS response-associated peptidase YedK